VTGRISTVAGNGQAGFSGDGGPAVEASLHRPHNLAVDPAGNLVIGDSENQRIRYVDRTTGHITTRYGTGEQGISEDGIPAGDASFFYFGTLLFDAEGDLLLTGWVDNRIRRIDTDTGIITTLAGTGEAGRAQDGAPAATAPLHGPYGLALGRDGALYGAEAENGRVCRIDAGTGRLTVVAGRP